MLHGAVLDQLAVLCTTYRSWMTRLLYTVGQCFASKELMPRAFVFSTQHHVLTLPVHKTVRALVLNFLHLRDADGIRALVPLCLLDLERQSLGARPCGLSLGLAVLTQISPPSKALHSTSLVEMTVSHEGHSFSRMWTIATNTLHVQIDLFASVDVSLS
jgi:hypothetical protein